MTTYELPVLPAHLANPAQDPRAACRGHDPELWFPHPTDDRTAAEAICRGCPIRVSCGQWATAARQSGIWGGVLLDRGKPEGANTKWRNPYPLTPAGRAS